MDFDIEMDDVPADAAPLVEEYTTDIVVGEEQVCLTSALSRPMDLIARPTRNLARSTRTR